MITGNTELQVFEYSEVFGDRYFDFWYRGIHVIIEYQLYCCDTGEFTKRVRVLHTSSLDEIFRTLFVNSPVSQQESWYSIITTLLSLIASPSLGNCIHCFFLFREAAKKNLLLMAGPLRPNPPLSSSLMAVVILERWK